MSVRRCFIDINEIFILCRLVRNFLLMVMSEIILNLIPRKIKEQHKRLGLQELFIASLLKYVFLGGVGRDSTFRLVL
jgi:hypothetical protein